jgi:predicted nucleic acid-binding protein
LIFCLDTDILIEYFRGNTKIQARIRSLGEADSIGTTLLSYYEFFKGIYASGKLEEEEFLKTLLDTSLVLESSYESAKISGEIYAYLKKTGQIISDADILIAGIVKSHDATLVTNNTSHFKRIVDLKVENWL